jgi:hypothetical protein
MVRPFLIGFLGTVAALMLVVAVWFAAIRPIEHPGLVWGGLVYESKEQFQVYLRSKGLSYSKWLKRNPGVAPWEPGGREAESSQTDRVWDWKRDSLLAVNAMMLAVIAAALLARAPRPRQNRWQKVRETAQYAPPTPASTRTGAHWFREHAPAHGDLIWITLAAAVAVAAAIVISNLLAT